MDVSERKPPVSDSATNNIETVSRVERKALRRRSLIQWMADVISRTAGSSPSLIGHALFFGGWLLLNTVGLGRMKPFDPFPFGLLTTIVSLEAIFLSLFILISQNRLGRQADQREHLDLQINLLAEQESTATLQLLRRLCEHEGVDLTVFDEETRDLQKKTNIRSLVAKIDQHLPGE
jgi:uncharacterized membrane protein